MSKVAVIEGSFMYHFGQQYEGKSVDYAALRQLLIEEFGVDRIYIHNCVKRNTEHGIVKLHDFLATNGFSSRLHHAREFGENIDYDISNELVVNLVTASKFAEEIIVVSTNNNLNPMIEYLSENGTIFSQLAVNPNGKMKRIYDNIFNLDDFADMIMVDKTKTAA